MRCTLGLGTVLCCLLAFCGGGKATGGSGSGMVCCLSADSPVSSSCGCQAPGTVSQGGLMSTFTVQGSSCTTSTTFQGMTSTSTGTVVPSCDNLDGGATSNGTDAAPASRDGASAFTPATIQSKLTFWFDPTSLVQGAGKVVQWTDLSGNGNDATQSIAAYQPAYTTAGINGLPSATFPGPVTFLRIADVASMRWGKNDLLVLVVVRGSAQSATDCMLYQKTAPPPYDGVNLYLNADKPAPSTLAGAEITGSVFVASSPPPTTFVDGSVHLVGVKRTGTTLEIRVDGSLSSAITNSSVANVDVSAAGSDGIIGQNGFGTPPTNEFQQFHGDMAEAIGINGVVAATDVANLEQYLKGRYAIP